jgi:hypothetical protein
MGVLAEAASKLNLIPLIASAPIQNASPSYTFHGRFRLAPGDTCVFTGTADSGINVLKSSRRSGDDRKS